MSVYLTDFELEKSKKIIDETIDKLGLDLSGLTVLTEVGSSYFSLTPVIALMANAKKVFAWTRDSIYGNSDEIINGCLNILSKYKLEESLIEFAANHRPKEHVAEADIITNSGFVRPLDKNLLSNIKKKKVVIPLMYEKWEWREGEIDKKFCDEKSILIGGTWENHPLLSVFNYCGHLAVKMCFEANVEIYKNNIILWSSDNFGEVVEKAFNELGANKIIRTTDPEVLYKEIPEADFVFFCDYHDERQLIGNSGIIDIEKLKLLNSTLKIIHLIGDIDTKKMTDCAIEVYPNKTGRAKTMTFTLSHLGLNPLIRLQTGGLKVAECLYHEIKHSICQQF